MNELSHISVDTILPSQMLQDAVMGIDVASSRGISLGSILLLIVGAVIMFTCFYLINEYGIKLVQNKRARASAKRYFPITTSFIWLGYFIYSGYVILAPYPLIGIGVILFLLLGFWRFIKDFIAGLVFRIQDNYRINQRIQLKSNSGIIVELLTTHVELESDSGERIFVPFTEFFNQIIRKPSVQERLKQFSLEISVAAEVDFGQFEKKVLSCPWIITEKTPRLIQNYKEGTIRISGYTIDLKYVVHIRKYLE